MNNGYIKLWRKIIDTSFFKYPNTLQLAIYILLEANHKSYKTLYDGNEITVERGQLITGLYKMKEHTGLTVSKIRTSLTFLKKVRFLAKTSTSKMTIITVCNYNEYQQDVAKTLAKTLANQSQTNRKPIATIQEVKEVKECKEIDIHLSLSELLKNKILENNPKALVKENQINQWTETVRLMIDMDKRTESEIKMVIEWCQLDSFWKTNVLSMGKLREKFDQLWLKMKGEQNGTHQKRSGYGFGGDNTAGTADPDKYRKAGIPGD